ncbi:hypothetical protein SAMN05720606_10892 [Paenibacillus polysaccharolyticus]|uniref:F5/8 type C domain-containing protein n=1 Tax=Paenibacillus polysaccharolyticus TaxID=582692 RepID=A0A1G5I7H7_9BACL|nr:hypothetical protein [Paenibacillus polysaccharolyticus]SCY72092.1 hypothetical protein SAMN05720606_10892 [Paenibacillus polysaccharolyticus]
MAIKRIRFLLQKSTLQYTALGGVRFYKSETEMINSGTQITASATSGETQNFLVSSDAGYSTSSNYYLPYLVDNNKKQTGVYTDLCYWLTDSASATYTITVEFKVPLENLYKMEFVPRPDTSTIGANRGVDKPFDIELINESGSVSYRYNVSPITQLNTVQTFFIPYKSKMLLSSGDKYYSTLSLPVLENPIMTSNSLPYGVASSSSDYDSSTTAFSAFRRLPTGVGWRSKNFRFGWLKYDFGIGREIAVNNYVISLAYAISIPTLSPKDWTFEGSNTGMFTGEQVILDSKTNFLFEKITMNFTIKNREKFRFYRINITDNNTGAFTYISDLLLQEIPAKKMVIIDSLEETAISSYGADAIEINYRINEIVDKRRVSNSRDSGETFEHTIDMSKRRIDKITLS